ncbi:unnamed protein product [Cylicocyclus nassatus]|uniref:Uncharacterized protein n=1 Tax=Cylicocyclus nassatus TaxID=53992 RepID=A0AA36GGW4_CYLNA|nr:unnamed protein product [Cylicocyclus nassatus]
MLMKNMIRLILPIFQYDEQLENRSIDYLNNSVITYNKSMIYDFPLDYFFDGFYYYMTDLPLAVEMWASDNESSMIMNKSDKVGCAVKQWTQKVIVNSNLSASDYILKKEEALASERDMGLLACYFNFYQNKSFSLSGPY